MAQDTKCLSSLQQGVGLCQDRKDPASRISNGGLRDVSFWRGGARGVGKYNFNKEMKSTEGLGLWMWHACGGNDAGAALQFAFSKFLDRVSMAKNGKADC